MRVSKDFWRNIHREIDKLGDLDPPREPSVRELFEDMASSVLNLQSEDNAESINRRGLFSLSIEPLHLMSNCHALMKVDRTILSPGGVFPQYKTMSESPGNVVYGLKVWMIDGVVHYRKRLRHETIVDDKERGSILVHLSEDLWEGLRQKRNDEQERDSFGYWTPLTRAGNELPDWDLWWFLVHRDADILWHILKDGMVAPEKRLFIHFSTEFDQEEWENKAQ